MSNLQETFIVHWFTKAETCDWCGATVYRVWSKTKEYIVDCDPKWGGARPVTKLLSPGVGVIHAYVCTGT